MKQRALIYVLGVSALIFGKLAQADSTYFNAVEALNPVAYWPLNETTQPPDGQYVATNSGTAGAAGNGYYGSWYQPSGNTFYATNRIQHASGATGDGDTALVCGAGAGAGQYVIVPQTTNGVPNPVASITAPFTIEVWVMTTNVATSGTIGNTRQIVGEGHNSEQGGASASYNNSLYGFTLSQYHNYFSFQIYNGIQTAGGTSLQINNLVVSNWYYVVATYDGTTERLYSNSVPVASANYSFAPDKVSPLLIGTGTEPSAEDGSFEFSGKIDDVAIYNTVLSQTQIQTHYAAASGTDYATTVLADDPTFYFRLDEPAFNSGSYPSPGTYPVATNYGTLGAAANGAYQPGTTPGVAGPSYGGFDSNTAVAINGFYGAVDVGGGSLPVQLNPTGNQPQTVVSWFRGNPVDARYQCIASHGSGSWLLAVNGQNNPNSSAGSTADYDAEFNPGNGPQIGVTNLTSEVNNGFLVNDGNWHMAVGVSDGTNAYLYLDGRLAMQTNGVGSLVGASRDALLGGNPSQTVPNYITAPNLEYFDGQIAQVAYFTNALDLSQVQQLYNAAGIPLSIVSQPQSVTNVAGLSASMTVGVSGSAPTYQWYSTNVNTSVVSPVADQTNASLVFNPVDLTNAGYYFVIVTNLYNSVTSSVAQLTVVGPPLILEQSPTDIQVFVGTTPTLQVTASGALPLSYQWSSNSTPIAGATAASYAPDTSAIGASIYSCIITNTYGAATNDLVTVAVLADPSAPYPVQVLADHPVAFYRLDEADGTTAYDYAGGNNAVYTNVMLGIPGYDSLNPVQSDPTETAAGFGFISPPNNYAGNVPGYLNFGTTNGGNAEFSVEAWVTEYEYITSGNCIVGLGYGNGGEQFVLDTGNTASGDLRFLVRNAAGTSYGASSTKSINDGGLSWHHVVGVCDEAGGNLYLYLDGNLVASGTIPAGSGLLAPTAPLSIGARQSANNGGTNYDAQLYGSVDDVAIYNYPLNPEQVQTHYSQSGIAPQITQVQPSSVTTNQSANVSFTVTASGTAPLIYQWFDNNNNPIAWGTNATLNLTNVQSSQTGTYRVDVSNTYGGPVSTNVNLTVTQAPQIVTDITPSNVMVYATTPTTLSVTASGSPPLSYQWYQNGALIPDATNATYSFEALLGTNTYYLSITNVYSAGSPILSSTATVVGLPIITLTPTNYTDHIKITFSGYNRGETLSDFPVLVRLSTNLPGFDYSHFASATGGDLRFTDSGGTRVIPFEIDQWNPAGESTVWVQVPALSDTNTFIQAYWGNPDDAALPDYATNGAVWLSQALQSLPPYELVYHLEQSGSPYFDSTLQYPATTTNAPVLTNGVIASGNYFSRSPYLDAGTVNLGNTFTLSTWANVSSGVSDIQCVWANGPGVSGSSEVFLHVNDYKTSNGTLVLANGNGTTAGNLGSPAGAVSLDQWHLLTAVVDRADGAAKLYVDGNQVASGAIRNDFSTNSDMELGQDTGGTFQFLGSLDEARIRSGLESSNWVWASWMTVAQNASLQSYSVVSSTVVTPPSPVTINVQFSDGNLILSGTGGSAGATYYVIGSTNVALPLASWPVLSTNTFDGSGSFNVSMPVDATRAAQFLSIKQ